MKTETATSAKTHFGRVLEDSIRGPVLIEKSGRKVAVILSFEDYLKYRSMEDTLWAKKAESAEEEGFIGNKASEKLLDKILNAKD